MNDFTFYSEKLGGTIMFRFLQSGDIGVVILHQESRALLALTKDLGKALNTDHLNYPSQQGGQVTITEEPGNKHRFAARFNAGDFTPGMQLPLLKKLSDAGYMTKDQAEDCLATLQFVRKTQKVIPRKGVNPEEERLAYPVSLTLRQAARLVGCQTGEDLTCLSQAALGVDPRFPQVEPSYGDAHRAGGRISLSTNQISRLQQIAVEMDVPLTRTAAAGR